MSEAIPKYSGNSEVRTNYDSVTHPEHYNKGVKYEPVKVIQDWKLNFCLGNVVKYVSRAGKKANNDRLTDLKKARQYLDFEIQQEENRI